MKMSEELNKRPVGVFDSGVGGLTVVKEIARIMPCEDIIYFGDTARLPYGSKSEKTIIKFSLENTIYLHAQNVKLIVIACNTASAVSLDYLRDFIKLPILGVIECGALGAVRATRNKRIGVIGTKTTVNSGAYSRAIKSLDPDIKVYEVPTPLLVHLVEESWIEKDVTKAILREYLSPLFDARIDALVLGCTHYPLLAGRIREIASDIAIIDSSTETANFLLNTLLNLNLLSNDESPANIKLCFSDPHPNSLNWARELLGTETNLMVMDYKQ